MLFIDYGNNVLNTLMWVIGNPNQRFSIRDPLVLCPIKRKCATLGEILENSK